jgi:hypothetical protein
MLKNLHKFYNKADLPWVHLIWQNYYSNENAQRQQKKGSFGWKSMLNLVNTFKGIS